MIKTILTGLRTWVRKTIGGTKKETASVPQAAPEKKAEAQKERASRRPQQNKERKRTPSQPKGAQPQGAQPQAPRRGAKQAAAEPGAQPAKKPVVARRTGEAWDPSEYKVPIEDGKTRFHDLDLPQEIMHAIFLLGFQYCTPIQAEILPKTLAGEDSTGRAQTGTGKTAAFLIGILTHILRKPLDEKRKKGTPRALILAPTRELVMQIQKDAEGLAIFTDIAILTLMGGMDYEKQKTRLQREFIDIVVATPGRLLDFQKKGFLDLGRVEILVIDEADRMLDMGFIPDVRRIIESTPPKAKRQTMLYSATITSDVRNLASRWTKDMSVVEIEPEQVAVDTVDQQVFITTKSEKFTLLYNMITKQNLERVVVFGNRRDETLRLRDKLASHGISCVLLSGDVTQDQRIKRLESFREGKTRVLVATDVAARGIHIEGVSHVVNYNLPDNPEDYVHRIGRTGRAGAMGISVSFASEDDAHELPKIEEYLGRPLECVYPKEEWLEAVPPPVSKEKSTDNQSQKHRERFGRSGESGGRSGSSRGGSRRRSSGGSSGRRGGSKPSSGGSDAAPPAQP
ncbi:MAG: DEAD/DEAH box helicase [Acidobacteriota bacterium]